MQDYSSNVGGRLPDFLIIGGMKCGTTTVYEYLAQHPGVFMSENKEPSYFSDDAVYQNGEAWYKSTFADAKSGQLCGEASTSYTRFEEFRIGIKPETWVEYHEAPSRIANTIPSVRLIYIMRHPVERAYSHYSFLMQVDAMMSFEEALHHHKTIIETSQYIDHINRYLEFFSKEQLCCVILDDFERDPETELAKIQGFLGLDVASLGRETIRSNSSGTVYAYERINRWINAVRQHPFGRMLARVMPEETRRKTVANASDLLANSLLGKKLSARHNQQILPMSDDVRTHLLDVLDESTCQLESYLGRKIPAWHK